MSRIREISLVMFVGLLSGCPKPDPVDQPKPTTQAKESTDEGDPLNWDSVVGQTLVVSRVGCPSNGAGGQANHCHMKIESVDGQEGAPHAAALTGSSGNYQFTVTTPKGTMNCESLVPTANPLTLAGTCLINEAGMEGEPEHQVTATLDRDPEDESKPWIEVHFSHPVSGESTKIHDGSAHVHPPR